VRSRGEPVTARVDTPWAAADLLATHWGLGGAGVVLAQPVGDQVAMEPDEFTVALTSAERQAVGVGVRGKELTPFLLGRLAEITNGQTLRANHILVRANARLAAQVATALAEKPPAGGYRTDDV
jgi:pseudouridine-5'-phosphate glycosidase